MSDVQGETRNEDALPVRMSTARAMPQMPRQRQPPATWITTTPKLGEQRAEQRGVPPAKAISTHRSTTSSENSKNDERDGENDTEPTNAPCRNDRPKKRKKENTDAKKNSVLAGRPAKSVEPERSTKPGKQKPAPKREPQSAASGAGSANPNSTKPGAWTREPSDVYHGQTTAGPTATNTPPHDPVARTNQETRARGQDAEGQRSQLCHRR